MKWTRTQTNNHVDYRTTNCSYRAHVMWSLCRKTISWCVATLDGEWCMCGGGERRVKDAKAKCEELMQTNTKGGE